MADHPSGPELKRLIGDLRCSVCRRPFDKKQVRIAARRDDVWIVSVRCSLCRHQQIFWIALKESLDDAPRIFNPEAADYDDLTPVTFEDVLDMHLFLKQFGGNFEVLFSVGEMEAD